jgi:hypothetical protein
LDLRAENTNFTTLYLQFPKTFSVERILVRWRDLPNGLKYVLQGKIFFMMRTRQFLVYTLGVLCLLSLSNCARSPLFSFNGASIPPDVKTLTVRNFYSDAASGPANLAIQFTEGVKEFFQRNSRLALINDNGDFLLEGTITEYKVEPVAPTAQQGNIQQIAGQQRLTITVKVQFTNTKDNTKDFDVPFSQFADFNANQTLQQVERELVDDIFKRIYLDIYNKTAGDW